jgi:hypothetical protein
LLVLFFGALDVRVFDAQNENAAVVPRKKPIEERRARIPHVDVTRGAGCKPNSNLGHSVNAFPGHADEVAAASDQTSRTRGCP